MRLLLNHWAAANCPAGSQFCRRTDRTGIRWLMMPRCCRSKRRWRRGPAQSHARSWSSTEKAFIGSHNVIDPSYRTRRNVRSRAPLGGTCQSGVTSEIVLGGPGRFRLMDWYFQEAGEQLREPSTWRWVLPLETLPRRWPGSQGILVGTPAPRPGRPDAVVNAMQLVPSGPATQPAEPADVPGAHQRGQAAWSITSPN